MVYVLNESGVSLMPTERHGKVKHLLRTGKAKVVRRCPFTIQLTYCSTEYTQNITLGVDAGSKTIGLSATTEQKELFASEVTLRNDIVKLLSTRREFRRSRRSRKKRYRKCRFDNRVRGKHKGWLAPSIENKIGAHLKSVQDVHKILPISKIVVETAAFDVQMLRTKELGFPLPEGTDYQQGEQLYFWNVREYVLFRDGHVCQNCRGKSKDNVLEVHHIESRKTGKETVSLIIQRKNRSKEKMKLNERYVETWREDKNFHIYQVIPPEGKSIILLLEGKEKQFVAAFSDIDDAREAIHGWSQKDQEGNPWKLNEN